MKALKTWIEDNPLEAGFIVACAVLLTALGILLSKL